MRVLAAEDDATSRQLLVALLGKWGYEVVAACDGNEAWAALHSEDAPRLVILDRMMPGMDGIEICARLREENRPVQPYVLLLTASGQRDHIVAGLSAGADDYVVKPFDRDELRARIQAGRRIVELQMELGRQVEELQAALAHVRTLQGILPICTHCHKIRDDRESWHRIDSYIQQHSDIQFSHSLCPECIRKFYPELAERGIG